MLRLRWLAPAAICLLGSAAAACGSSAAPTIPSLRSPGSSPTASISPEQAMRAYVTCLRGKGIDMPDPKVGADGYVEIVYPDALDKGVFAAADEGCRDLLVHAYPPTTPNPNGVQEQDQLLAYARCMREHGIAMGDPAGAISVVVEAGAGPNEATASFAAADRACAYLLPGKPGSSPSSGPSGSSATPPTPAPAASGSGSGQ